MFDPDGVAYFMRFDSVIVYDSAGIDGNSHTPGCGFKPAPRNYKLPHHLITPADVGLVHAAFQGESSGNYATNVIGSNEAATV